MSTLTKKQRNTVYKAMLELALKDPSVSYGFCHLSKKIYYEKLIPKKLFWKYVTIQYLSELISFEPKDFYGWGYWFDCTYKGWEKRIEILQKCIELTN